MSERVRFRTNFDDNCQLRYVRARRDLTNQSEIEAPPIPRSRHTQLIVVKAEKNQ